MAKYTLNSPYFDGVQVHKSGTVLDFPEGSTPPKNSTLVEAAAVEEAPAPAPVIEVKK